MEKAENSGEEKKKNKIIEEIVGISQYKEVIVKFKGEEDLTTLSFDMMHRYYPKRLLSFYEKFLKISQPNTEEEEEEEETVEEEEEEEEANES